MGGGEPSDVQPTPHHQGTGVDELSGIFVGKNYDYFKRKWEIAEQNRNKQSWNWAAFLFGFSWMAYRKMYLYSWIFVGLLVVESLCEYAFGFSDKLSHTINVGINVVFGWQGNYLYKLHVEKKTREIRTMNAPEQAHVELARQGGTSIGAAFGFFAAALALVILVALVGERQESTTTVGDLQNRAAVQAVQEYEIVRRNGTAADACLRAGNAAEAFLQLRDETRYRTWKRVEQAECSRAGVPVP